MDRITLRYPYTTPTMRFRGFRIGRRLAGIFRWAASRRRRSRNPFTTILNAARRGLGCGGFGYSRLGPEESSLERRRRRRKPWASAREVPKGHLAVNVEGGAGGDRRRVLVPVVYVNHPLFGDLLREAERVYGYEHDGGIITLPCGISELARVHDRIAAGEPQRQRDAACCWTTNDNCNSKRRLLV